MTFQPGHKPHCGRDAKGHYKQLGTKRPDSRALPPELDRAIERCASAVNAACRVCGDKPMCEVQEGMGELRRWRAALIWLTRAARATGRTATPQSCAGRGAEVIRVTKDAKSWDGRRRNVIRTYAPKRAGARHTGPRKTGT